MTPGQPHYDIRYSEDDGDWDVRIVDGPHVDFVTSFETREEAVTEMKKMLDDPETPYVIVVYDKQQDIVNTITYD